jgi:hypothetical protein
LSDDAVLAKMSGRRKTRYFHAAESLKHRPIGKSDAFINAFVKAEKMNPNSKHNPAPRMIQAANARYNFALFKYLKPMEHNLYQLRTPMGHPVVGKGLNTIQRAEALELKMAEFNHPVVWSLDASRFDQHVAREVLEVEHSIYNRCCHDPQLRQLLSWQLDIRGITTTGIKYKTRGKRMSGHPNTALGNCLLMYLFTAAAMRELKVRYELFVDGDDTLVIVDELDEEELFKLPGIFLRFGQELKIENRATELHQVNWCQSKPCLVNGRWQFVADYRKVLSSACAGVKYWHEEKTRIDMAFSVGQCLLALYSGAPIIGAFAQRLCDLGGKINRDVYESDIYHKVRSSKVIIGDLKSTEPTAEARELFSQSWDIDFAMQRVVEESFKDFNITGHKLVQGDEITGDWVLAYEPGTYPTQVLG